MNSRCCCRVQKLRSEVCETPQSPEEGCVGWRASTWSGWSGRGNPQEVTADGNCKLGCGFCRRSLSPRGCGWDADIAPGYLQGPTQQSHLGRVGGSGLGQIATCFDSCHPPFLMLIGRERHLVGGFLVAWLAAGGTLLLPSLVLVLSAWAEKILGVGAGLWQPWGRAVSGEMNSLYDWDTGVFSPEGAEGLDLSAAF